MPFRGAWATSAKRRRRNVARCGFTYTAGESAREVALVPIGVPPMLSAVAWPNLGVRSRCRRSKIRRDFLMCPQRWRVTLRAGRTRSRPPRLCFVRLPQADFFCRHRIKHLSNIKSKRKARDRILAKSAPAVARSSTVRSRTQTAVRVSHFGLRERSYKKSIKTFSKRFE